jgi:hypothetical protein
MTRLLGPAIGWTAREEAGTAGQVGEGGEGGKGVGIAAMYDDDYGVEEAAALAAIVDLGPARWLVDRIRKQQVRSILRIVRWLDRSLNNTSVILLVRAGNRRLLFPGDAQIENWQYTLTGAPNRQALLDELARVDLYKVGHHGSRNGTPKSLYRLWHPGDAAEQAVRSVRSLMSTRDDVYGEKDGTKVPSGKLMTALDRDGMRLFSTLQPPDGSPFVELAADTTGDSTFEIV